MPAFNAGRTIGAAIESVLAQTRKDFELIVVNDGSTDDTAERVEPYLRDQRVSLLEQRNGGQASARNAAIAAASGEYVGLLDSDDLWLPQYLDEMGRLLDEAPSAAVAYTDAWILDDETRRVARSKVLSPWHPPSVPKGAAGFLRALLEFGNFVFVAATIRRSALADVGGFRLGVDGSEDYEMWLRIAARGYGFVRAERPLAIYRRRAGQWTADPDATARSGSEVLRIFAEESDVPDDIRELARRQLPITRFPPRQPRRVPRVLRPTYDRLSRVRHFYVRPPREVRKAFPDLRYP